MTAPGRSQISAKLAGTLATTVTMQALAVVTGAVLARSLGVENRGALAAVILWPSLIAYIGDLGLAMAFAYLAASRADLASRLPSIAVYAAIAQSVILVIIGAAIIGITIGRQRDIVGFALVYLVCFVPLNLATRYLNAIHQGESRFDVFNRVRLTVQLSNTVWIVLLFLAGVRFIAPFVAAYVLTNFLALLTAARYVRPRSLAPTLNGKVLREALFYGLKGHLGNLTPVDSMQLDLAVVVAVLSAHDVGLYTVALSAAMVVRSQGIALGMVALPSVASGSTRSEQLSTIGAVFRFSLLTTLFLAGAMIALAPQLITLVYGAAFEGAGSILRILAAASVAAALRQLLSDCLRGLGHPLSASVAELCALAVAAPALMLSVPRVGVLGAAASVAASYVVALGVTVAMAARAGVSFGSLLRIGPRDIGFVQQVASESLRVVLDRPRDWFRKMVELSR